MKYLEIESLQCSNNSVYLISIFLLLLAAEKERSNIDDSED
jgi:hypothetical protein